MERFEFAELYYFRDNVCMHCTNSQELPALFTPLKNFYSDIEFEEAKLPSGEVYWMMGIRQNWDGHEGEAFWWLVRQLCERGWEPLTPNTTHTSNVAYIFRRKVVLQRRIERKLSQGAAIQAAMPKPTAL